MSADQNQPKVGAIAVVLHEGKFLLVQRGKDPGRGLWGFPGGHVEFGEPAMRAAERELMEETGVQGEAISCLTAIDIIGRDDTGVPLYHYLLAVVPCRYVAGEVHAADDAADAEWVPAEDVIAAKRGLNMGVATVAKQVWEAAKLNRLEKPVTDGVASE